MGTSVGRIIDPLNVLGTGKPPMRIGITHLELSPLLVPKALLFEENLTFHLGTSVTFDLLTPRQIRLHLGSGRLKFAVLTADEYCQVASRDVARILAVPLNEHQQTSREGLVITAARSQIRSPSEIKGLRFHFLVNGHPLNEAAMGVLLDAGISPENLNKGLLGLELDQYHISSMEVARSVVIEERTAGVIDKADYDNWPEVGGSLALFTPSKDQVRVIGHTVRVPEGPFVVSRETDPELSKKVQDYLIHVLPQRRLVLASLGYSGFAPPIEPKEYEPYWSIHRRLHPDTGEPATQPIETQATE